MNEESLFAAALEKPTPAERRAFLDEACGGDAALRERVERLLAADEQTRGILERGPDAAAAAVPAGAAGGRSRLRRPLHAPPEARRGRHGRGLGRRPDRAGAAPRRPQGGPARPRLRPPARPLRAGAAGPGPDGPPQHRQGPRRGRGRDGRPYFVMELIEGVPITDYCDEARLSPRERLELFIPVCQAVQHAHQKGIIHRDLKPSNILVALYDGKPVPKVIDFGVAKATGPRLTEESVYTEVGSLVGTLEYMSPEQAELNNLDIDTRSDVYALGVVLYELLTGSVPFPREELQAAAFAEMLRIIKEVEPPKPSTRLSGSGTLPSVAAARQTEPRKLAALVRGELDWIVMKCLEKDRARRYETADGLALDVQRYLADEVVAARPPSPGYRLRKFVRRNKGRVAGGGWRWPLTLVAGLGAVAAVQAAADRDRAAAATDRATREAAATASVAAAVREARARAEEAWDLHDDPDRMQRATAAAVAAIHRADDFAAAGSPTEAALAELAATRQAVDDLVRHTRLVTDLRRAAG